VASQSPSYSLSFAQHAIIDAASNTVIADGLACRRPNPLAMEVIWENVARIVEVPDAAIAHAMRAFYEDTHNLAEGAGAAALAGALQEKDKLEDKRVGIVLTGANVNCSVYEKVLAGTL